jgi:type I restriction enzyme S subunit
MSVDKLRETHHINRVAPSDLGLLMSAQSYRPEITRAIREIKSFPWAPLQSLVKNVISPGPHPVYGGTYPCLKTKNVNGLLADLEAADFVDVKGMGNLEKVQVERGDLLINLTGAGSIGRVSVYYGDDLPITNQHIARMGIKDAYDEGYVAAFLRTWWGERALEQGVAGSTGQINMVNDHVRSIPVILFNTAVQKYIGNKVRQAERLRTWGTKCYQASLDLFQDGVTKCGYLPKPSKNFVWTKLEGRIDPAYYDPKYSFLDEEWFLANSSRLQEFIADGAYGVLPDSNSYGFGDQRFIRATDIRLSNIDPTAFTWVTSDQVAPKAKIKAGDILLEIKGAIEACELAGVHLNGTYVNGSIYRFTPKGIGPGYLAFYLRSFIKQLYCERVSVNSIIAYLDSGSISSLPVLRLAAEQEDDIEQAFLRHLESARYAFALGKAAKQLVEALIKGQLAEGELIAAEQALQAGNDQIDRRILSRLKTDGIDGQGRSLFSDLDEFSRLLAKAEVD